MDPSPGSIFFRPTSSPMAHSDRTTRQRLGSRLPWPVVSTTRRSSAGGRSPSLRLSHRRYARVMRWTLASSLAFVVAAVVAMPADANIRWCKADPVVEFDGTRVQILVAVPEEMQSLVNGPIFVALGAPREVTKTLISTDQGFNGHGEVVRFFNTR